MSDTHTLNFSRTDYFTYVGDGAVSSRASEQVWNLTLPQQKGRKSVTIAIKVQGTDPVGTYNPFAKKHLLTVAGGKNGNAVSKLAGVLAKRTYDYDENMAARQVKHDALPPKAQANHNSADAYGGRAMGYTNPLTMIYCEMLSPADLKKALGSAALAIDAGAGWAAQNGSMYGHCTLNFPIDCVWTYTPTMQIVKGRSIGLGMYKQDGKIVTYHINHAEPGAAGGIQANA